MQDEDNNPILNDIAKSVLEKGGIVDVFRIGRGVLGSFKTARPATGGMDYSFDPPRARGLISQFWCIDHSRGTEMMINGDFERLEIKKIQPNVFHVIIPK